MAQPPPYVIFNDYSDYQAAHQLPGPALLGSDLDAEHLRIKATLDAILNNLALIQRSDGVLNNQSVSPDTITSALAIMIANWTIRGAWVTATAYALKDYVTNAGNGYVCIVAHTGGTFATDLAAGKWALVSTKGDQGIQGIQGNIGLTGPAGPIAPTFRNRFINGDFRVDQRNNGAGVNVLNGSGNLYTLDRWYCAVNDSGVGMVVQRVAGTGGNQSALRMQEAAGVSTSTTLGQRIASENCYDLVNQNVVVSATVSSSGSNLVTWTAYRANSQDNWAGRTLIATGTFQTTATPTAYNFTFNAGSGVTSGLNIEFVTGPVSILGTVQYENVQLELGTQPTAFEKRHLAAELAMCQRHCLVRRCTAVNQLAICGFGYVTNTQQLFPDRFPVEMFKAPTFSISAATDFQILVNAATLAATSLAMNSSDKYGALLNSANATFGAGAPGSLVSANANARMTYDAEL